MTLTGRTLSEFEAMGAAGTVALIHFVEHLPLDSATACEASGHTELREWSQLTKTNILLADLFDNLSAMQFLYIKSKTKKGKAKQPKPYPRPWRKDKTRKVGRDPVPVSKFWDWWEKRLKEVGNGKRR